MQILEAAQDKSWQQGARDLLLGMALRMWEDYRDGYLPREKFNIYNLWWNLSVVPAPAIYVTGFILSYLCLYLVRFMHNIVKRIPIWKSFCAGQFTS